MNRKQIVIDHLTAELHLLKSYINIYGEKTPVVNMKNDKIEGAFSLAQKLDLISYEEFHKLKKEILYNEN